MWSRVRSTLYRYRPPPLLPTAIRTIQLVAAYHLFSTDVLELRFCAGFSMFPTFSYEGDLVAVSPIPYWSMFADKGKKRGPQRGDVVVFTKPTDPEVTVLKRVIGIAGDIIEIEPRRGSENTWDAESDEEVWAGHGGDAGGATPGHVVKRRTDSEGRPLRVRRKGEGQWVKVPKGHVWVQGDNFSNSTDSRSYGPVPIGCIKGKVLARVYPNFRWMSSPLKPFDADPPRSLPDR